MCSRCEQGPRQRKGKRKNGMAEPDERSVSAETSKHGLAFGLGLWTLGQAESPKSKAQAYLRMLHFHRVGDGFTELANVVQLHAIVSDDRGATDHGRKRRALVLHGQ